MSRWLLVSRYALESELEFELIIRDQLASSKKKSIGVNWYNFLGIRYAVANSIIDRTSRVADCLRALLDHTATGVNSGRVAELIAHYRVGHFNSGKYNKNKQK